MRNRRSVKAAISVGLLLFSGLVFLNAYYGFRATSDEPLYTHGILAVFESGTIPEQGAYNIGNGFPVLAAIILKVTGLNYASTDLLSPAIGGVALAVLLLILTGIVKRVGDGPWWGSLLPIFSVLAFAGFINRVAETSHKAMTYTLIFLLLYITLVKGATKRWDFLYYCLSLALAAFNIVWAFIYLGTLMVVRIAGSDTRSTPAETLPLAVLFLLPLYLPTQTFPQYYPARFLGSIRRILSGTKSGPGSSTAGAVSGISGWPTVSIANVAFSEWFLYVIGILVVATLGIWVSATVIWRVINGRDVSRTQLQILLFDVCLGGVIAAMFFAGDIATVKRLIVVPGVLTTLSALIMLNKYIDSGREVARIALAVSVVVLIATTPLTAQRVLANGEESDSPYDYYADESDISKVNWIVKHQGTTRGCAVSHRVLDKRLAGKIHPEANIAVTRSEDDSSQIYSNGDAGMVSCLGDIPEEAYW